ncbi:MAG: TonB-dependent receptor plug domain-containing protein [Burkholderiaceae bacterium]
MPKIPFLRPCLCCVLGLSAAVASAASPSTADLASLPLDQLLGMEVSGASKFASTLADTAAAVTVVGAAEIRALGCRTLADVLATVKGVTISTDRSYSYIGVRGFYAPGDYNTRVLLLIDGNRVNDALYDQAYIGSELPIDLALLDRVEFIPGQASAIYGANALFGVVNLVTRRPEAGAAAVAEATIGTHGDRRLRLEDTFASAGGTVIRLSASSGGVQGQDVESQGAVTRHGDFEQRSAFSLDARHGGWALSLVQSHRTRGNPAILDTAPGDGRTRNIDNQGLYDLSWSGTTPAGDQAAARVYAGSYHFIGRYVLDESPVTVNQDTDTAHWGGAEAHVTTSRVDGHRLTAGAEFQVSPRLWSYNADVAPASEAYLDRNDPSRRIAAFAEDVVRVTDALSLDAGVRVDATRGYQAQASGRFALVWKPAETFVAKAIVGTAYRPPNDYEAHYQVAGPGGYQANPRLRPEAVRGSELNFEWHPDASDSFSGSIYENVARRLVVQARDDATDSYTFVNQGTVIARGAEVEWQHAWVAGWRVRANASTSLAVDRDTGTPIAVYAPHYVANLTAIAPVAGDVQAGLQWRAVARRGGAGAYTLANLSLASGVSDTGWSWSANVQNLFDRRYGDPGTDLSAQPSIRQAGRSAELTVSKAFR